MDDRTLLTRKIMAYSMAAEDSRLFLDTHPNCDAALDYYNMSLRKKQELMKEYESTFGAMSQSSVQNGRYSWISTPWPWQI